MDSASVTLDRDPASAGAARRLARSILERRVPAESLEVIELLVSEVVTNVILHATSSPEMRIVVLPGRTRVEVRDGDPDRAAEMQDIADPTATSGRGLAIVDSLATDWGTETVPGVGKCVWFEVAIGESPG
jgi:anti-sigma regulatory factor (Ser/Thr protein kinase)